jgi:hypothetical protein
MFTRSEPDRITLNRDRYWAVSGPQRNAHRVKPVPGFGVICMATHPGFLSCGVSLGRENPHETNPGLLNVTPLALDEVANGHTSCTRARDSSLET